ncbi:MAG: hypothetical protein GXO97_01940, partial [Nitrospirae bacterium]|nr:hypothetical protein [Nitrospirota bacterium]
MNPQSAKITKPSLSWIIPRERLFRKLEQGREFAIIWITGPPGSGKTSLVCSYLEHTGLPFMWYQVDDNDEDVASFFYYMGIAGRKAAKGKESQLPLLTPEYLPDISTFAKRYFEKLYSMLTPSHIIVFDNYQDVSEDSMFHRIIREGLNMIPEGLKIVIVSRNKPPALFMRFKANGLMFSLDWDDLRFTYDELSELILSKDLELPADTIKYIQGLTDGWAAGIVLLLETMKRKGVEGLQYTGEPQNDLFEYFAKEVFEATDDDIKDFLVKTALLPDISPVRAEELTTSNRAAYILSELANKNYFTFRFYHREISYRYHPLFREFLLYLLNERFTDEEIVKLKISAAKILESEGQVEDAIRLFSEAEDWQETSRIILENAQTLILYGRGSTLARWIYKIPRYILNETPYLYYWLGMAIMPYDPEKCFVALERAYHAFKKTGDI